MCAETLDGFSANGFCAARLNTMECGFDGGDCCECDCIPERANRVRSRENSLQFPNRRSGPSLVTLGVRRYHGNATESARDEGHDLS